MEKQEILAEKKRLADKYYKGRCFICRKPFGKGFVFHHIEYGQESPDKNDPFYFDKLFEEIQEFPDRFYLIHNSHHQLFSHGLIQMSNSNFRRFMLVTKKTRKCQRIEL